MISIIIPNYNGVKHLKMAFESISNQTYTDYRVILVDNGSNDESVAFTENNFPQHKIIKLEKNYGFSKAVNQGIRYSLDELNPGFILILNNDIELSINFLEEAVKTFSAVPDASFIAVKMLNYFDREIIDNTGDFIKSNGGSPLMRGFGDIDSGQYNAGYIFGACAGAAFYKPELFKNTGFV